MEKNKVARDEIAALSRRLRVCGHPVRLRLLCAIERKEPCVSDLSACVEESQPVVSQHLAALKRAGIVSSRTEGNRRIYSVDDPFIKSIIHAITARSP
jgi:DNA-binding transcriptional ArsR family regulator